MNVTVSKLEIKPTYQEKIDAEGWSINMYGTRAATITNPEGKRITTYFGFNSKEKALQFEEWLFKHKCCEKCKVRKSQRLGTRWEAKVWKCPTWLLEDALIGEIKKLITSINQFIIYISLKIGDKNVTQ
ncbi:hypothetical protein NIES4071_102180 (plasmid) [Calothrix sp. NIES-4071]|nr:hypothetical protein NIES4071_102180 [Calothrix sp. NIES-4071]BAZ64599.1 hypothetical protein NIES4105_103320 [Calothrix sp. NIES-4105]